MWRGGEARKGGQDGGQPSGTTSFALALEADILGGDSVGQGNPV